MAEYATILVEQRGAVTLVTLNRPEALNALNSAVLEDLIAAFAAFEADPAQRCAVLTGAGEKAFAAGADIKEMADKDGGRCSSPGHVRALDQPPGQGGTRKPWIAAVNGFALGGGCELAMMADFIIAADTREVRPARDHARRGPRHGRHPAADPRDRQGQGDGPDPHRADDRRRRGRARRASSRASSPPPICSPRRSRPPKRSPRCRRSRSSRAKELVNAAFELPLEQGIRARAPPVPHARRDRGQGRRHGRVHREAPAGVEGAVAVLSQACAARWRAGLRLSAPGGETARRLPPASLVLVRVGRRAA